MASDPPLYQVLANQLIRDIESGKLPPASQLPVEDDLVEKFGASRNTVRKAIAVLITRRLVETRQGQGTFVVEPPRPFITTLTGDPVMGGGGEGEAFLIEVRAASRVPSTSEPDVGSRRADKVIAAALKVDAGTDVIKREQQRFIEGRPWSLQTSYYPMSLLERGATDLIRPRDIERGTVAYLKGLGISQKSYRDSIGVRPPNEAETNFFTLPLDGRVPVFEILRTAFDEDDEPFRLTVTVYPADRNRFIVNVGNPPGSP